CALPISGQRRVQRAAPVDDEDTALSRRVQQLLHQAVVLVARHGAHRTGELPVGTELPELRIAHAQRVAVLVDEVCGTPDVTHAGHHDHATCARSRRGGTHHTGGRSARAQRPAEPASRSAPSPVRSWSATALSEASRISMSSVIHSPVSRATSRTAPVMIPAMLPTCVAACSVSTCTVSLPASNRPTMSPLPAGLPIRGPHVTRP